ncbi:hypothetical protein F0562_010873 [Nyssa sinensis]|uniref:Uncharacterized protein n=1 Tax=Nyssa sinensis TaxID=561372 RepID=A0A5J5A1W8_9ASTE|nr:hypothetical protein F0562_010873 [Nyssa sinensis]
MYDSQIGSKRGVLVLNGTEATPMYTGLGTVSVIPRLVNHQSDPSSVVKKIQNVWNRGLQQMAVKKENARCTI